MIATTRAIPAALLECKARIYLTANITRLAGGGPFVDFDDLGTSIAGNPFQDGYKLCERKVGYLPSPKTFHRIQAQVLNTDDGVLSNQVVSQLEEPVSATVADLLVHLVEVSNCQLPVMTAFLATRQAAMRQPNLGQACLKPFRRVNCCTVIQSKEMFQTEVHPDRFTCSWKNVVTFLLDDNKQKVFALSGSFDCNSFDSSINGAGFPEFIFSPADDDHIAVRLKRIAGLLESETLVLGTLRQLPPPKGGGL